MIHHFKHNEINKEKWDYCLDNSPNGLIYARSWYLDIVCPGWEALVNNDYSSVMPLPVKKKYGFYYIYPPPYTQQLGLFSTSNITEKDTHNFLSHIPAQYKYIEMNLNEKNEVAKNQFKTTKGITHLLNLNNTYSNIFAGYSTQTKRNLKKAQSASLIISKNANPEEVINLFRSNRGKQYSNNTAQYETLNKLLQACTKKGVLQAWGVTAHANELYAGAFFLQTNGRVIFLFSGAGEKAYQTHAMTFLLNKFIEDHAGQNLIFDFEGSKNKDLARFYSGFGSTKTEFIQIRKNILPPPAKWIKEISFRKKLH